MAKIRVGLALTGSFCTFERTMVAAEELSKSYELVPIMSETAASTDTRFGKAEDFKARLRAISGGDIVSTIAGAEPLGPKGLVDVPLIAPCTGNTLAKLANGVNDTAVTMAAKALLRNGKPVILAVSTNDGLSAAAENIGKLLARENIYFVPFGQDAPEAKPRSLVADYGRIAETIEAALEGRQAQPILI